MLTYVDNISFRYYTATTYVSGKGNVTSFHYTWNANNVSQDIGQVVSSSGFTSLAIGTTTLGFVPKGKSGSTTTYYCDYYSARGGSTANTTFGVCIFGADNDDGEAGGLFQFAGGYGLSFINTSARIAYL